MPSGEKSDAWLLTSPWWAVMFFLVRVFRSMSQMSESLVVRDLPSARYRLSREIGPRSKPSVLRWNSVRAYPSAAYSVHVEVALVALVGGDEERLVVVGPAEEARVQLLAGREVFRRAVLGTHEHVAELVAALVAGVEDAAVAGERRRGENGVGRRLGQLLGLPARGGDQVGVVDARGVGRDQDLRAVGRERRPGVLGVLVEIRDRVPGHRRRRRRGRLPGRTAAGHTGPDQTDQQTKANSHGPPCRSEGGIITRGGGSAGAVVRVVAPAELDRRGVWGRCSGEPLGRADGRGARDEERAGPFEGRTDLMRNFLGVCSIPILRQSWRHTLVVGAALVRPGRFAPFLLRRGASGVANRDCRLESHAGSSSKPRAIAGVPDQTSAAVRRAELQFRRRETRPRYFGLRDNSMVTRTGTALSKRRPGVNRHFRAALRAC